MSRNVLSARFIKKRNVIEIEFYTFICADREKMNQDIQTLGLN